MARVSYARAVQLLGNVKFSGVQFSVIDAAGKLHVVATSGVQREERPIHDDEGDGGVIHAAFSCVNGIYSRMARNGFTFFDVAIYSSKAPLWPRFEEIKGSKDDGNGGS